MTVTEFARLGGFARAKSLTKAERSDHGKKAATARWAKVKKAAKASAA